MPHAHFASPRAQKQCDLFIWCHESRCMPISDADCTTQSSMGTPCPPPPIVLRSGSCHRFFRHPRRVRPRSFDPFARGPIHTQGRLLWCAPSLAAAPAPSCAALPALSSLFPATSDADLCGPPIDRAGPARAHARRTLPRGTKGRPAARRDQRPAAATVGSAQVVHRGKGPMRPHAAASRRAAFAAVLVRASRRRVGGDCRMSQDAHGIVRTAL